MKFYENLARCPKSFTVFGDKFALKINNVIKID